MSIERQLGGAAYTQTKGPARYRALSSALDKNSEPGKWEPWVSAAANASTTRANKCLTRAGRRSPGGGERSSKRTSQIRLRFFEDVDIIVASLCACPMVSCPFRFLRGQNLEAIASRD